MLAVIGITTGKGTTPSCDPYGTFLRTEGCNDIYADGSCGEYSVDNGSCACDGCDPEGTFLRTEGCNDIYADGCCGEYSVDNGSCDPCAGCPPIGEGLGQDGCNNLYADGCCGSYTEPCEDPGIYSYTDGCNDFYSDGCCGTYSVDNGSCGNCNGCSSAGTLESTGTGTAWANTVDADGTDWNINYQDFSYADGCCGTYSERHWFAFFDTSPVELSSPDEGVSPNPPAGYVLTASAVYPLDGIDEYTYASYADDPMWVGNYYYLEDISGYGGNYPWQSRKIFADGSGGYYAEQTVQDAGTVMSDVFAAYGSANARFYSTGTTFDDAVNGIHPSFDIISCGAYGSSPTPYASNIDWTIEITLESLGIPYALRVGTKDQDTIDNGECGRTVIDTSYCPEPVNTLLYDETISSYYYYSDGEGGYYSTFYG